MVSDWNVLYDIEQKQAQSIMLVRYEGQGWKDELYQSDTLVEVERLA